MASLIEKILKRRDRMASHVEKILKRRDRMASLDAGDRSMEGRGG